jgi:hypothetical protein
MHPFSGPAAAQVLPDGLPARKITREGFRFTSCQSSPSAKFLCAIPHFFHDSELHFASVVALDVVGDYGVRVDDCEVVGNGGPLYSSRDLIRATASRMEGWISKPVM